MLSVLLYAWLACVPARAADSKTLVIESALASQLAPNTSAFSQAAKPVSLPDDWSVTRPHFEGSVWYRAEFLKPPGAQAHDLMALYIERACSNVEVFLNGERIYIGGSLDEPVTRNCAYPQLITLPEALLRPQMNTVELRVQGHALQRVASRHRAGGLSTLQVGSLAALTAQYESSYFWNVAAVQLVSVILVVLGIVMIGLGWMDRRDPHLGYFGWLSLAWAVMSLREWWRDMPWDTGVMEFLFCTGFAPLVALAVQFLLSFADLRSRWIENALVAQWVFMPATLLLAGPSRLFAVSCIWSAVLFAEVVAASCLYLVMSRRAKRRTPVPMTVLLSIVCAILAYEINVQYGVLPPPHFALLSLAISALLIALGSGLLRIFAHNLRAAEDGRASLEGRVQEITAEIERNFAQLAELRVEQVTEKERKRIAADLHDDLGAKLLTIVHTSESERISTLAREALEEMRLSVRGLTGKPMRLADALADWRAETVSRLGQANIEADWRGPTEEIEQLLPARGFVQTTRILREAVSNIIKHSGASHCKVRCAISEHQFGLTVQDNGKGIPMELDGKLDRGHGMSSMKHRAKQMQGQCLVESGPGYGTVIRLTLPL